MIILIAQAVLAGQSFVCTPTRVWDGDGPIWCKEGPRIRLAAIAARERDGTCRRNQPCPKASGITARDALVRMLGGPKGKTRSGHIRVHALPMRCLSRGADDYGRTVAWCSAKGVGDLSCAMVKARVAVRWARYGGAKVCNNARR